MGRPGKVLLFGWLAHGNIGSYADALAEPANTTDYPDITLTRGHDRYNYGFALSAEQSITDAWAHLCARAEPREGREHGLDRLRRSPGPRCQPARQRWYRPQDIFGPAGLVEGLSPIAQRYFKAGGMGIVIGDGTLADRPKTAL